MMQPREEAMSGQNKDHNEELCRIMDAISDPVLEMTDEEIIADAIENGENPEELANQVKGLLLGTVKTYKQRRLHAAQREYEQEIARMGKRGSRIPPSIKEQRQLLSHLFIQKPQLLTLQNREFQDLTDGDVASLLMEFEELGTLDDLDALKGE